MAGGFSYRVKGYAPYTIMNGSFEINKSATAVPTGYNIIYGEAGNTVWGTTGHVFVGGRSLKLSWFSGVNTLATVSVVSNLFTFPSNPFYISGYASVSMDYHESNNYRLYIDILDENDYVMDSTYHYAANYIRYPNWHRINYLTKSFSTQHIKVKITFRLPRNYPYNNSFAYIDNLKFKRFICEHFVAFNYHPSLSVEDRGLVMDYSHKVGDGTLSPYSMTASLLPGILYPTKFVYGTQVKGG